MLPDRMIPFWDAENNVIPIEKAFPKSIHPANWVDPLCGHRWVQRTGALTTMFERMDKGLRGSICPACEGNVLIVGKNDLGTTHPELCKYWNSTNELKIDEVSRGSAKVVSWTCSKGHNWKSKVKDQVVRGAVCMKCKGKPEAKGRILLKLAYPEIFAEALSVVGSDKRVDSLTRGSSLKVTWECAKGHVYDAVVSNRTTLGRNCPYCAGRYSLSGENDIATTNPEVLKFWDYEINILRPEEVQKTYSKPLNWICEKKHRWVAVPENLTIRKQYCPYCSGKRIIPGETDFASLYPEKLALWDYDKNVILPSEISAGNAYRAHWKCALGHEWKSSIDGISSREKTNGCAKCKGRKGLTGFNDLASLYPELLDEWNYEKNDKKPSEYSYGSGQYVWWKCNKGHEWEGKVNKRTGKKRVNCPTCALGLSVSRNEQEIYDFILSLGVEAQQSIRNLLDDAREVDIYVPSRRIAIEYNGVYWHSEAIRGDKNYHYNKWKDCKDKGIQLIQIWEDEWNRNPEQIKSMLAHKLGISSARKVYARKTVVVELDKMQAEVFLEENHIQGYASGSYYLGLKEKGSGKLVSVLVLKKEAGTDGKALNIIRYATSSNVIGGFTKLLTYATKTYQPESYLTFSDHCVSDGGLYENNGFIADKELMPDYMYVIGGERKHKFSYRLKRFRNDPDLIWEEGLTERELAKLNNMLRIWDAGKTRWIKPLHLKELNN